MQGETQEPEKDSGEPATSEHEEQLQPERDRRGIVLPARQRVGGIITPQ